VQSVAITAGQEFDNMTEIVSLPGWCCSRADKLQWQQVEKVAKSSIQEKKIRVAFLPPVADDEV
jgi:hypothetical protein